MSFGIYIVGFIIAIGGLIYGAVIMHLALHWIVVATLVLLGIAIVERRVRDAPEGCALVGGTELRRHSVK